MCGHPHRNCNEPCKLWRHTPAKFLRIASSECWQKSSRDEWGCSRNVLSVGGPWQLECERSMELTASFLPSLLPLLVEPQKLGRITSIRVTLVPESTRGHNTGSHSQRHRDSKFHPPGVRWSVGTFARPIGSFAFSQMNLLRDCYLRTHQILRGHTRIFARAYFLQLNYVAVAKTMCHVGIKSARPFIAPSSELQWGLTLTEPLRPTILTWTEQAGAMGGSSQLHRLLAHWPQAWNPINKFTARSRRSSHLCPVSANSIASQLMKTCMIMETVEWQLSQLQSHNRKRQTEQVTTPQEWRPTGIRHGTSSLQHQHLWHANHHLKKVCICWRSSNHCMLMESDRKWKLCWARTWKPQVNTSRPES